MKTARRKRQQKKQAFVFTLDAMLVLPLVILIISSLIAFSSTLKENVLLHEYTYIIAKDSVNYLTELEIGAASTGLTVDANERNLSVLAYVTKHLTDTYATRMAITGSLNSTIPSFVGYIFEYQNSSGGWSKIAEGGNTAKFASGNYSFQVSVIKLVSGLSDPIVENGAPCSANVTCTVPRQLYTPGQIIGPVMFRIRVYS